MLVQTGKAAAGAHTNTEQAKVTERDVCMRRADIHTWKQSDVKYKHIRLCLVLLSRILSHTEIKKEIKKTVTVNILKCTLERNVSCAVKFSRHGSTVDGVLYAHTLWNWDTVFFP